MKTPPYYKLWIYSINGLLIIIQIIFIQQLFAALTHPWTKFFPVKWDNWMVFSMYISTVIQFFACISGILGAFFSNKTMLRIYWIFMIPILTFDIIKAVAIAFQFQSMHRHYGDYIEKLGAEQVKGAQSGSVQFCDEWSDVQLSLQCCSPSSVTQICNAMDQLWRGEQMSSLVKRCDSKLAKQCVNPLLRWFHSKTDVLGIIAYFILFPLKLIVVIVLREDIQELFGEIIYTGHQELYRHWAAADPLEDGQRLGSSQNLNTDSISSTVSLVGVHKVFGA